MNFIPVLRCKNILCSDSDCHDVYLWQRIHLRQGNGYFTSQMILPFIYVSLCLRVQNAVSAQPCVGKFADIFIFMVLLNFLHCKLFRDYWFETP